MAKNGKKTKLRWQEKGWELWEKEQGKYVVLYIKRPDGLFRIYSGRIAPHGFEAKFESI